MWHWKTEIQLDLRCVCLFGSLIQLSKPSAAPLYVLFAPPPFKRGFAPLSLSLEELRLSSPWAAYGYLLRNQYKICWFYFIEVTVVYSLPFGPLKTPFQSGIAQTKYQRSVPPRITLNNICYQMCKTFSNICDQFLSHYYRPFVSKTIAKNPPHGPSLRTETFCSFHLKLQNHREQRENLNMFPLCWSNQMWRCRL